MSRTWEDEVDDPLAWGRYNAALRSSLLGKRGQQFLRDLVEGLESLPEPELALGTLADPSTGCVCALGAVALQRGCSLDSLAVANENQPPEDTASDFDISATLANEIMYVNDEAPFSHRGDERQVRRSRWRFVHRWAKGQLAKIAETGE